MTVCKQCGHNQVCHHQHFRHQFKRVIQVALLGTLILFIILAAGKAYQISDRDPERGAIPISDGALNESYKTPKYLNQGWGNDDSLWFYNTTQGSDLIPYDFFMVLEKIDSQCPSPANIDVNRPEGDCLFRSHANIDKFRYLPQDKTRFNPDSLPVGFVKDEYNNQDYIGYTCAACHTGQVNYQQQAIRIDGGPSMADMVGFLQALETAMQATLVDDNKRKRFIANVLHRNSINSLMSSEINGGGNYSSEEAVLADLKTWTNRIALYNQINHSNTEYGYARLDAFGRIYNRVLEHVINKEQAATRLALVIDPATQRPLLSLAEINQVVDGLNEVIIGEAGFEAMIKNLQSHEAGFPGLNRQQIEWVQQSIFNEANAPVSYPFLWDIAQSDYVQWNGLAANAGIGPLGRNTGEVIGVFGKLDWQEEKPSLLNFFHFNLAAKISGQDSKKQFINFKSSVDKVNLKRLESHISHLMSPQWPDGCNNLAKTDAINNCYATTKGQRNIQIDDSKRPLDILPDIDLRKAARGQFIYAQHCQSCHEVIDRSDWDRKVIGKMMAVNEVNTDPAMAHNGASYTGASGNFKHIYQATDAGTVIVEETAPVVQILTAATRGVIATRDYDKIFIRRWGDWLYAIGASLFDNTIKASVKVGDYQPDTTAEPYASLNAYKARSLNGIWATAPYLHNGSVPTLYDLLLPKKNPGDPELDEAGNTIEYRPDSFVVGAREFDPVKVGFVSSGYDGFIYNTQLPGNSNAGHEYAPLSPMQRMELVEYLKTL